jgi:16S rRNA (cytosine967-C5)-methyltransferase
LARPLRRAEGPAPAGARPRARGAGAGPRRGSASPTTGGRAVPGVAVAPARVLAFDVLERVETTDAFADRLLETRGRRAGLEPRDRALATEIVLGTLRWRRWLDWHLGRASHRPLADLDAWARTLLRLTAYQLAFLGRVPAWAAVHDAVELAKRHRPPWAAAYVNGVLRALARMLRPWPEPAADDPVEALALRTSQPTWLVEGWWRRYGPAEAEALARAMNETPPVVLRVNTLRATPAEAVAALEHAGARARPARLAPEALVLEEAGDLRELAPLRQGLVTVQDEAAILVGHALGPEPGETVADVCAAPGTKTTHLAALMRNRGRVVAADPHPGRLALLREACTRLGATIVEPRAADVGALAAACGPAFDRVLVDAPCSNLGVLRRNPEGKWRRRREDLARLAVAQGAILEAAARLVRPGGILLYATCSLEPEENEAVVAGLRGRHPAFRPDPLPATVPAACRTGPDVLRTLPHRHGSDGFTAHRLRRRA